MLEAKTKLSLGKTAKNIVKLSKQINLTLLIEKNIKNILIVNMFPQFITFMRIFCLQTFFCYVFSVFLLTYKSEFCKQHLRCKIKDFLHASRFTMTYFKKVKKVTERVLVTLSRNGNKNLGKNRRIKIWRTV